MDQMLLREALSDLKSDPKPKQALESLAIDAEQKYLHLQQQFAQQFDASDYTKHLILWLRCNLLINLPLILINSKTS